MCEVPFPGQSGMNYSRSRKNALHRKKFHVLMMLCVMFQTILEGVHLKVDCFIQKIILRILLHLLDCVSILIDIELEGGNDIYPPHPRNGILNREKKNRSERNDSVVKITYCYCIGSHSIPRTLSSDSQLLTMHMPSMGTST